MIFKIYYTMQTAGWFAVSVLLGSYVANHAEAREFDLAIFLTITPMSMFLRPLISAYADRRQAHKRLLVASLVATSLAYLPFILWPYLKQTSYFSRQTSHSDDSQPLVAPSASPINWPFWCLCLAHLIGSIAQCGARALSDASAVNLAKRVGADFTSYRVYGSYSYGLMGYLIGFVNEGNQLVPDFVPGILLFCTGCAASALLVWLWPDEYFRMQTSGDEARPLPQGDELWRLIKAKLLFRQLSSGDTEAQQKENSPQQQQANGARRSLSTGQQLEIFKLLVKRDFRIILFLLLVLYTGFTAYAALNYVFIYVDEVCRSRGSCSGAEISALMMIGFCILEAIAYKCIDRLSRRLSTTIVFQIIFVSISLHFYFYAFVLDRVSPYWFLVESLHGLEYACSLWLCVNLGYQFAREVDLIIPELIERGTIEKEDKQQHALVRVSLMATITSLFTLVYDGASCSLGALAFGQIAGRYSFQVLWMVIGTLAVVGIAILLVAQLLTYCLQIEPQIVKLQARVRRVNQQLQQSISEKPKHSLEAKLSAICA